MVARAAFKVLNEVNSLPLDCQKFAKFPRTSSSQDILLTKVSKPDTQKEHRFRWVKGRNKRSTRVKLDIWES